jgi:argininosuccinate lyase
MLLATDLADYLVNRGIPFRKAHECIGKAVALCAERGCELPQLTLADYQTISPAFAADVFDMLRLEKSMSARQAIGAPSPENVAAQLARWKAMLG